MTTKRTRWAMAAAVGVAMASGWFARKAVAGGIPPEPAMTYAGVLEDAAGVPLSGTHDIEVRLWDSAAGGNVKCDAVANAVTLVGGRFQVPLADVNTASACTQAAHDANQLWVEVSSDGLSLGRTKLGAVPYAVEADHALNAAHATNADNAVNVPLMTDWADYTPTLSVLFGATVPTTVQTTTGAWRREGDSVHVRLSTQFTGGSVPSGTFVWSLPSGKSPNVTSGGATVAPPGFGLEGRTGSASTYLYVAVRPEGYVFARHPTGDVTDQAPIAASAGVYVQLDFVVPVIGWTTTTGATN